MSRGGEAQNRWTSKRTWANGRLILQQWGALRHLERDTCMGSDGGLHLATER